MFFSKTHLNAMKLPLKPRNASLRATLVICRQGFWGWKHPQNPRGQSIKVAQRKRFSSSIFFFVRAVSSGEVVFFFNLNTYKNRYIHSSHGCEFWGSTLFSHHMGRKRGEHADRCVWIGGIASTAAWLARRSLYGIKGGTGLKWLGTGGDSRFSTCNFQHQYLFNLR